MLSTRHTVASTPILFVSISSSFLERPAEATSCDTLFPNFCVHFPDRYRKMVTCKIVTEVSRMVFGMTRRGAGWAAPNPAPQEDK